MICNITRFFYANCQMTLACIQFIAVKKEQLGDLDLLLQSHFLKDDAVKKQQQLISAISVSINCTFILLQDGS